MGGGNSAHCFFVALIGVIPFVRLIAVMHQKKIARGDAEDAEKKKNSANSATPR